MNMFPIRHRVVRSPDALQAAIKTLSEKGAWFEVTPESGGRFRIKVKAENENLLPALKDWSQASDFELRQLVCDKLSGEFITFNTGEAIARDEREVEILSHGDDGFSIRTEVWIDYPTDEA